MSSFLSITMKLNLVQNEFYVTQIQFCLLEESIIHGTKKGNSKGKGKFQSQ